MFPETGDDSEMIAELPAQIAELFADILATGNAFTFTVTLFELTQPEEFVSVTVYEVVEDGFTVLFELVELNPDAEPDQEYVLPVTAAAPMVADSPAQIVELVPALAAGSAFTVTKTELLLVQPVAVMVSTSS